MMSARQTENEPGTFTLSAPDLRRLTHLFGRGAFNCRNRTTLLHQFLQQTIGLVNGAGGFYFSGTQQNHLQAEVTLLSRQVQALGTDIEQQTAACTREALLQANTCYSLLSSKTSLYCICCPLSSDRGCLALLLVTDKSSLSPFLITLQLLAALLDEHLRVEKTTLPADSPTTGGFAAALLELLTHVFALEPCRERINHLNQSLKMLAGADLCALALVGRNNKIHVGAVSDVSSVDMRTEPVRLLQKGAQECVVRNIPLFMPEQKVTDNSFSASLILEEIGRNSGCVRVAALPLKRSPDDKPQAVLLLGWKTAPEDRESPLISLLNAAPILAGTISWLAGDRTTQRNQTQKQQDKPGWSLQQKVTSAVAGILLLLLFLPVPYRITAEAIVKPDVTRFVVSRYDGLLLNTKVRPGDQVKKGQELARLDGREIEVEIAEVQAELDKANKLRDQATALGNTAAAQVARLDALRYKQQLIRLSQRKNQLVLTSPVNGIVLSGDLQRAEGSPVSRGQTLFEVAPLEIMDVEVTINEETISRISSDTEARIRFAAYPGKYWQQTFTSIKPRAQIRNNKNVFIGLLQFKNEDNKLRPGMQGSAKIHLGSKPLGWIIFHKPWYTLVHLLDTVL